MKKIKYIIFSLVSLIGVLTILIYTWDIPAPTKVVNKKIDVNSQILK
jgi:hypothetical protein